MYKIYHYYTKKNSFVPDDKKLILQGWQERLQCIVRLLSKLFCLQLFFPKRFSFFTVCLVHCLCGISPQWTMKEKFLKFRSPDCWKMHFWHSFWLHNHNLYTFKKHDFFCEYQLRIPPFCYVYLYFFFCSGSNFCWNFRVLWAVPLCVFVRI